MTKREKQAARRDDIRARAAVNDVASGLRMAVAGLRELGLDRLADAAAAVGQKAAGRVPRIVTADVMHDHKQKAEFYFGRTFSGLSDFAAEESRP